MTRPRDTSPTPHARPAVTPIDYADLLDLARDAIIIRDLTGSTIRYWNHGAEQLYGWTRAEALGQPTHELLQTRLPQPLDTVMTELVQRGYWCGELEHTTRDGRRVVVDSRWTLRRDAAGQPRDFLEINTDMVPPHLSVIGADS